MNYQCINVSTIINDYQKTQMVITSVKNFDEMFYFSL